VKPTKKQLSAFGALKKIDPDSQIRWSKTRGTPNRLRGRFTEPQDEKPERISLQFLSANKDLYKLQAPNKELLIKNIVSDRSGSTHVKYQQIYKDIPVFGSELIVHLDADNVVKGTNGKFTEGLAINVKPTISAKDARSAILKHNRQNKAISGKKPMLMILVHKGKPCLVWHLTVAGVDKDLENNEMPAEWEYFINARSGKIVWRYNNIQHHTRTTGSGTGHYLGNVTINTVHNHTGGNYELEDQWLPTSARIHTHDSNGGTAPGPISEDSNNNWSATGQEQEVDCHVYSRMVYDYFLTVHGRDSYDDAGADMHIHAHVNTPSWMQNNAAWSPSSQLVKVGDGDGVDFDSWCALDVLGHEWTHAVTEHTAGLVYSNESGALNESMSDVFACLIDGGWLFGEDIWLGATAPAVRNLEDPTNGGQYDPANPIDSVLDGHQPDHMNDIYTGALDNGGVHINSGIMNKAAHLIAAGGTHRGIPVCDALGRDVLGRLYYQALTTHLTSSSDFEDMRDAVLDALDDLYSGDPRYGRWEASIINAFAAVGIGHQVLCISICWHGPSLCPPAPGFVCPPSPDLLCPPSPRFMCPPAPDFICPPSPSYMCPPSPSIVCPPSPHGCLPGPDPIPFDPDIRIKDKIIVDRIMDIKEISGIGNERARLLSKAGIKTVKSLVKEGDKADGIKKVAGKTGISEKLITKWHKKAKLLVGNMK
jgi:thermolysin